MGDTEVWTADECAAAWGVKTATWLGYVSRAQAPAARRERDERGRRVWDAVTVRTFPRPGSGHSRASADDDADHLLAEMRELAQRLEQVREQQKELLREGKAQGLEIKAMAHALGISRQTAYSWLDGR